MGMLDGEEECRVDQPCDGSKVRVGGVVGGSQVSLCRPSQRLLEVVRELAGEGGDQGDDREELGRAVPIGV
jgi:hypothetical protein